MSFGDRVQPLEPSEDLQARIDRLERRLKRERAARQESETISERATRALYDTQQGLLLVGTVAQAANEAKGLEDAIAVTLEAVRAHRSWSLGHLWLVDRYGDMASTSLWAGDVDAHAPFPESCEGLTYGPGEGLPGRVLLERAPVWMSDADGLADLPRGAQITAAGLRTALCFPILAGEEVVGVLEFFAARPLEASEQLLALMAQIGTQLGRVVERQRIDRAKDEFTSVVSHELRTPLTAIRGSLGLLGGGALGPLSEGGQKLVEMAISNTDRLVRLINDILDIERIDAGRIDIDPEPCDAELLVKHALASFDQIAAAAEVTLTADAQAAPLIADPHYLHQTLTNLISNAIKFSPAGAVVHVSAEARDGHVHFSVRDQGRGIPREHLDAIFRRFHQVDGSDSREKGGTGLGLAICRGIVERHGGRIWAESEPGAGATFSFVLPARGPEA